MHSLPEDIESIGGIGARNLLRQLIRVDNDRVVFPNVEQVVRVIHQALSKAFSLNDTVIDLPGLVRSGVLPVRPGQFLPATSINYPIRALRGTGKCYRVVKAQMRFCDDGARAHIRVKTALTPDRVCESSYSQPTRIHATVCS